MNAKRDQNQKTASMGISSTDNITPIRLKIDPLTNYIMMTASSFICTPTPLNKSKIDQNGVNTLYGVSDADGTTLIPIRTNDDGELLITM